MSEERHLFLHSGSFGLHGSAPPLHWQSQPGAFFGFVLSLLLNPHPLEVKCAIESCRPRAIFLTPARQTVASRKRDRTVSGGSLREVRRNGDRQKGWDHDASRE